MENFLNPISLFIFGSCVGSFLNVYRFRYPKSISIIFPGSFCPKCKKKIPWFLNLPIISWFFLNGKCNFCKSNISFQYPLVEFLTATLITLNIFATSHLSLNYYSNLIGLTCFTSFLIAASLIDFDNLLIPNDLLLLGSLSGLIFNLLTRRIYFGENFLIIIYKYLFMSFVFLILFEIFNFILRIIIKKEAFGFGDSKFLFMISTWLGIKGALLTFILSIYIGGIISIFLILFKVIPRKGKIPFGPYLSLSAYVIGIIGSDKIFIFFRDLYIIK